MKDSKINGQIIKWIKAKSGSNKDIADFLVDLIFEEAEHPGEWWWKETYKTKIKEYSKKWSDSNEN